ncbi:MAG: hypothetical protein F4091_04815 [Acidimicrobiales bacterium]|nr:hypothetical protein [Acidimicrobiales bacterium]MYD82797.1 hypothetical protein [Acidimicrobiales bacterium]MYJ64777.1 hypothetical protein [Acidimicrobiales bacterium]
MESPCTMDEYCERDRPPPARFVDIAAGRTHTCGLLADGRVQCWGNLPSEYGYTGTASSRAWSSFVAIDAHDYTCGLRVDRSIFCWDEERHYPRSPSAGWRQPRPYENGNYTELAVTASQVCALDVDGRVECWPIYHWGEPLMAAPPPRLGNLAFASIDAGAGHVCGLHHDGAIYCWGSNAADQLNAPAGTSWTQIAAGAGHTCALDVSGKAACWGDNSFGQSAPPQLTRFSTLSAGELHTCGLRPDGTAECWGSDIDGQATPPSGGVFTELSAGAHHTCGLTATGEPLCWGLDAYGQSTPPPALERFTRLFTDWWGGQGSTTCGLRHDGVAQCWGPEWNPTLPMGDGTRFADIVAGRELACGLLLDGRATCWRYFPERAVPNVTAVVADVPGELRFTALMLLGHRACGLTNEGRIRCWGARRDTDGRDLPPPPVGEHVAVAAKGSYACALAQGGIVNCWSNREVLPADLTRLSLTELGTTSIGEHFDAGQTASAAYRSLTLGNAGWRGPDGWERARMHGCALHRHQTVTCWGADDFGQASPPSGVRFSSIAAGSRHTCGITVEGDVRCWGANDVGQSRAPPDELFSDLYAEGDGTCGLRDTGEVICWGDSQFSAPAQLVPFIVNLPEQHFTDITALDRLGIFEGTECSTQQLCTDAPLTRATMAVWLDRLLAYETPSTAAKNAAPIQLDDVPTEFWWADHAQRLLGLGVITPCDAAAQLFCPGDHVVRTELEQALVRAAQIRVRDHLGTVAEAAIADVSAVIAADVESTCIDRRVGMCRETVVTRGQAATVFNRFREHVSRRALPEFTSVSADGGGGCGRRSDGTVECWGYDGTGEAFVGSGDRVLDVFYDGYYWCGTSVSRERTCHGWDGYARSHVREALTIPSHTEIAFGSVYACGVEPDGAVTCVGGLPSDGSEDPWENASPSEPVIDVDRHEYVQGYRHFWTFKSPTGRFSRVAVGFLHRCALKTDGTAVCWGKNKFGEAVPPPSERFSHLALGTSHSCGLRPDGSVTCWGYDADGRSSPPSMRLVTPAAKTGPAAGMLGSVRAVPFRLTTIAASDASTCGITLDGLVSCWGTSRSRRPTLEADESWNPAELVVAPPTDIEGRVFTSISATDGYFCAASADGYDRCWGTHRFRRSPDADASFIDVSVNTAYGTTCGRRTDSTVQCWNSWRWDPRTSPTAAEGLESITTASTYACGRSSDGVQSCWTLNPDYVVPAGAVAGDFVQLSDSGYHTCTLGSERAVECWGRDDAGEAISPPEGSFVQISAGALHDYTAGDAGYRAHTCGVRRDGSVECWGDNGFGQSTPPSGKDFVKVAASGVHACGLRRSGNIECWGQELLRGGPLRPTGQYADVVVGAGGGFDHEADDGTIWHSKHVCGLRVDGVVECWGDAYRPNKPYNRHEPDYRSRFTSISSGDSHVCGVRTDGAIECWGQPAFIAY